MNLMMPNKDLEMLLNNNFKLIALDVDGTLINSDHILTARTLRAIKNAKDAGITITIATGRHYLSSIRMARKIQINAPLICSDGAIIKDIYSNNTIYNLLPREIAIDVMRMALDYKNFKFKFLQKTERFILGQAIAALISNAFCAARLSTH